MSSWFKHLLILCAVLIATASTVARAQQYSFQAYERKDGLESQTINCLLQDRRGFIWAGTEMGLYRFNGSHFERLGATEGFDQGEYVTAIKEDSARGRIWVATQSGMRVGDGRHFEKVEPNGKPLVADVGRTLAVLDDGRLLLVRDQQLVVLTPPTGAGMPAASSIWKFAPYFSAVQLAAQPQLRTITAVYANHDELWLGCGNALCEIDGSGRLHLHGVNEGIAPDRWSDVLLDGSGTLWVRGVHHVRARAAGAIDFSARDVPNNDMSVVTDGGGFVEDGAGRILTRTDHGLVRWEGAHWQVIDHTNGLPEIGITAALFDKYGALWLGTYGRGIYRWRGYGLVEGWGAGQGLDGASNWSILRDDQGLMWFGNELGGSVLAPGASRLQPWPIRFAPAPRQILALAKAPDGAVWASLYDHRLLRYDPATGRTSLAAELPSFIKTLHFDRQGRLWIATVKGIYRIDHTGALAQRMPVALTTDDQCSDMAESGQGTMWFACDAGVLRFEHERWTMMRIANISMTAGFAAVAVGADDSLWLGANEPGVFHATVVDERLDITRVVDPWLDKSLAYFVRRDRRGWIWVGGGGGVDVYDGAHWTHLSEDDGLIWDETDQNAFFEDNDGSVWIGTAVGVSHILHPEALLSPTTHTVILTSIMHGAQPVADGDSVNISGRHAPLTVRYSLLGRTTGSAPHFRYRLQGSDWIDTTSHVLVFTGLPFGDYRVEIQALDDDHRSVSASTTFNFSVPSPWWLQWWTYPIELLALVSIVLLASRWRSRRLMQQNRRLESMVDARTAELTAEKYELELARAELYDKATHDGLTGMYNRMAVLEHLSAQLHNATRKRPGLAVALIDIDYFKRINDTYGHQAGDATLQNIARELQSYVRGDDRLGRYGGEEILMVLPGIGQQDAGHRMRDIQRSVSATEHSWQGHQFHVTLSIGMVWIADETVSVENVIKQADAALYEAKSSGRDRVVSEVIPPSR